MTDAITFGDIQDAAARIASHAVKTPLLEAPLLNQMIGGRVLVKAECLQRTGAFKFRGAINRILQLSKDELKRGVVAYSSGNHAQAISHAAHLAGTSAVIVMPKDAPEIKVANTRAYGGEIVFYDRYSEDRAEVGARLAEERGLVLVPPYDDVHVLAGQGTLGIEVVGQSRDMGASLNAFLVPCSGGGLTAGSSLALEQLSPDTKIYGVEPEDFDDTKRSIAADDYLSNAPEARGICDALQTETPGNLTFPINKRLLTDVLTVSDDEVLEAMAVAHNLLKITVEPGGAVALAALLSGRFDAKDKTVCVVCSGGNVDPAVFQRALAKGSK